MGDLKWNARRSPSFARSSMACPPLKDEHSGWFLRESLLAICHWKEIQTVYIINILLLSLYLKLTWYPDTLSIVSPAAASNVCPSRRNSSIPLANARREWPPETRSTRKGKSTGCSILTVRACASIWCIGMNGFSWSLTNFRLKSKPIPKLRARPGFTVVATAVSSLGSMPLLSKASWTTLEMFSLCSCWATGGIIPPAL